jgi:hypothetical protein
MRVGIIELLALPSQRWADTIYHSFLTKQFASVTPQAISVWCRQLGHETFYAIYYGVGDARHRLPPDLDIIFIACHTQTSPMAYAFAKLYRKAGTRTVIGGPHAKSFPVDCLRFFDLVVKECDKELIADILAGHFDPGTFISSAKPFDDLPTVEERMPEIRASAFFQGKWPLFSSMVPMLASMGCPNKCDFCTDWDNPYRLLSTDRLAEDLRYLTKNLPGTMIGFHDPNFGIKFDPVFDTLEAVPPESRVPYIMECSLSILRKSRMERLKETNCIGSVHGIESWMDYSGKAGVGQKRGLEKVQQVVEHFQLLSEYVPYIQAGFIFGLDTDMGDEPITLMKNFMDHTPFVWPNLSIPLPLGGTPLYKQFLADGRILKMPFGFYFEPYFVFTLKNYDPVTYLERLIDLSSFIFSKSMLKRRMKSASNWKFKFIYRARAINEKKDNNGYRRILDMLRSDSHFRAFHEGQSEVLPEFYHKEYDKILGPYAELLSQSNRVPNLEQMNPVLSGKTDILKVSD